MSQLASEEKIPRSKDVPEKDRDQAIRVAEELADAERARHDEQIRARRKAVEKARGQLRSKLGAEGYELSRRLVDEHREQALRFWQTPDGPKRDDAEIEAFEAQRRSRFRSELGIDPSALEPVFLELRDEISKIYPTFEEAATIPKAADVPEEIRNHKTNPWSIFRPPYAGWQRGWLTDVSGYSAGVDGETNTATGEVETLTSLRNNSADDLDIGLARMDAQIGFWFFAERAGLIEAWIEAQSVRGDHLLSLRDEWGWSSQSTGHTNFLMMHPIHQNVEGPSLTRVSWYNNTRISGFYSRSYVTPGNTYWGHVFSDGVVPANTWIWIRVGNRSVNVSTTNDVSIRPSSTAFSWFIRSVQVRTTG